MKYRLTHLLTFVVGALVLFAFPKLSAQAMYTVTDLGTLPGGNRSSGLGINSAGQVVGYGTTSTGANHAFLYNAGTMTDLGTLPGGTNSAAYAINGSGQVAGYSYTNCCVIHAFLYDAGTMNDIGMLPDGAYTAFGLGINASGQVTGSSDIGTSNIFRAFLYSTGMMTNLGTLSGGSNSAAYGINDSGQVTGYSDSATSGGNNRAFLYSTGVMTDLGTLPGGNHSEGYAINVSGQVTGISDSGTSGGKDRAFMYRGGTMIDLGTLPGGSYSVGFGINAFGEVAGYGDSSTSGVTSHAFLHAQGGGMIDLNTVLPNGSGWTLTTVARGGMNDAGQITGTGTNSNGATHAFLLTPIYKAAVQQPINADGTSVFSAKRGVVPVKFALTENGVLNCTLPATIFIARTSAGTMASVDENIYSTAADSGSNFRIDQTACQYIYNVAASSLGQGTYRVDINTNGIPVGHAAFALQ